MKDKTDNTNGCRIPDQAIPHVCCGSFRMDVYAINEPLLLKGRNKAE